MAVKEYKPTSPGRRNMSALVYDEITTDKPEKSLLVKLNSTGGRNNQGRITSRRKGGGHKRNYRIIDFKRDKDGVPCVVKTIEYDPNRNALISLVQYVDGEKRYIIAPEKIKVGDKLMSGEQAEIRVGNSLRLISIPVGTLLHNIEMKNGKGGQLVRSAGTSAQLVGKVTGYCQIKLASGTIMSIRQECRATIGTVGNAEHMNVVIGKAGRSRWLGKRPKVRGVAMNPVDHPHGGGEGKAPQGNPHPVTPWGVATLGFKTRKRKSTSKYIIKKRK